MGYKGVIGHYACAFALLAVALFSFASVCSVTMQAQMGAPGVTMPMCGSMAGAHAAHPGEPAGKAGKTCEFCSAAAHAPICGSALAIAPSSSIAWTAYAVLRPLGPRGPPEFTAKAQGPPASA